ncbi:uncharacterized protein Z520_04537 [Fonsecaea multimorphosa CBS 102226]|uniref:Uncharacterized protein n=1 Tax=Fonsecaea multimorphosa CBS 102226 TaxID=1442371 RepID=A0A0D2HDD6_9EURO|nr:uncharacterized protein Z520_04537 [Fonsecaea multimorphosa CBS 102226]KIX99900.1 hypothetical protein Z520_04537 [Fonsecaea multimorphosa CBS 102226]OAL26377.1 hypothetical protein AYO22_04295 [Fonsecaea multimorphosa]
MTTDAHNTTTDPTLGTSGNGGTTGGSHNTGDTSGKATYTSSDASTAPHAPSTHKILGDIKGAVHGVTGSLQAATGTMFGQKNMAEKGFDKMSDEDARLAAKTGKPPVGTDQRGTVPESNTSTTTTTTSAPGAAAAEHGHGRGLPHERT